jgi:hypothetical protein
LGLYNTSQSAGEDIINGVKYSRNRERGDEKMRFISPHLTLSLVPFEVIVTGKQ